MSIVLLDSSSRPRSTRERLAKIRAAMWSTRWNGRFGPRPLRPDNILAMDFYQWYNPNERREMLDIYRSRGYTHAVTGPLIDPGGYHGHYPVYPGPLTQVAFNRYLDAMTEWVEAGIQPVHFAHPDGWTSRQMEQLVPFYEQPRAQDLLQMVVWTGWEPSRYEWSNADWVNMLTRGADVFPNALRLVHTAADVDALVGGLDDPEVIEANRTSTWARSWANVVPYLHGWLVQVGPYPWPPTASEALQTSGEFRKLWSHRPGSYSLWTRFNRGEAGWPTGSAWGPTTPLKIYYAEGTAYCSYWQKTIDGQPITFTEPDAAAWGDLAMDSGADGYLDGGTVMVT